MDVTFENDGYKFLYRVSSVIFNKDKTKILLFNVEGREDFFLVGGKVSQKEESIDAIKREISEELGYKDLDFTLLGVSEEFVEAKGYYNQQINLIYQTIYKDDITETRFKGLEGDWINFEWVDIKNLDTYNIYPHQIKEAIKTPNKIYHFIENLTK